MRDSLYTLMLLSLMISFGFSQDFTAKWGNGYKLTSSDGEHSLKFGGRIMYDTGGSLGSRHFPVLVEPGETIIPKTQNMLGGSSGITLNIQGDIVTNDAEDFAHRIAEVLPQALRAQNDMGGI